MIGGEVLSGLSGHLLPQVAVLVAALSYAFAGVFGRRFRTMGVDPMVAAAGQVTGSSLILIPLALIVDMPWQIGMPSGATVVSILGLAALSTAAAYIIYFWLLERAGATNLLLVTFLIPVSAIALGVLVLGEVLSFGQIAGASLIGAGLLCIDGRIFRRR